MNLDRVSKQPFMLILQQLRHALSVQMENIWLVMLVVRINCVSGKQAQVSYTFFFCGDIL